MNDIETLPSPRSRKAPLWRNAVYVAFAASFVYVIPVFRPLPTSPLTFLTILTTVLLLTAAPAALAAYRGRARAALWCFGAIPCYMIGVKFLFLGSVGSLPLFMTASLCMALLASRYMTQGSPATAERCVRLGVALFSLSMIWFLLTYFSPTLFAFHTRMYQWDRLYTSYGYRSGLATPAHLYGYQIVPLILFLIGAFLVHRGARRWLIVGLLFLSGVSVILYGERSVILAVVVGMGLLFLRREYRSRLLRLTVILSVALGLFFAEQRFEDLHQKKPRPGLGSRLASERLQSESFDRIRLQWEGLQVAWDHPQGLVLAKKSWHDVMERRDLPLFDAWGRVIPVHNGYIGRTILYGWPLGLLIAAELLLLFTIAIRLIRSPGSHATRYGPAAGAALVGSLIQAFFHNSSFANLEVATVAVIMLALALYSRPRPAARPFQQ